MNITPSFWQVARVPARRYGHKFKSPKFRPRWRRTRRFKFPKPKWMK